MASPAHDADRERIRNPSEPPTRRPGRVAVVVLGPIEQSPRMLNHVRTLTNAGSEVVVVAQADGEHPPGLGGGAIRLYRLPSPALAGRHALPRPLFVAYAALRLLGNAIALAWALAVRIPRPQVLLVQTPPALPTLPIALLLARVLRPCRLVVDWHNLGFSILALHLGARHPVVGAARWLERRLGRLAHAHLCVSRALRADLIAHAGLQDPVVLYDRPSAAFRPADRDARNRLFPAFTDALGPQTVDALVERSAHRPAVLISPSSFTADEDLDLLLDGVVESEARMDAAERAAGRRLFPRALLFLTGRSPRRAAIEARVKGLTLDRITVLIPWLPPADYALLVGSADIGICVHRSSSGLDLPMKIADMTGGGLAVLAFDYGPCLGEILSDGETGLLFRTADDMADALCRLLEGFPANTPLLDRLKAASARRALPTWDEA